MAEELVGMSCVACRVGEPTATEEEIATYYPQIPDWQLAEQDGVKRLERFYKFPNFARAMEFTNRVADMAETEGHHPTITTEWGKVTVSWWTHKIRGLHRNDFVMAAKTDRLYAEGQ